MSLSEIFYFVLKVFNQIYGKIYFSWRIQAAATRDHTLASNVPKRGQQDVGKPFALAPVSDPLKFIEFIQIKFSALPT